MKKVKHKMKYIEDRYLKLCNDRVPPATNDQLVSMIQILKPEHGFTINAFLNNRPYTPEEEAEWQEEYENGWKPKNRGERISDWTEFLITTADIREDKYRLIKKYFQTKVKEYKEELYKQLQEGKKVNIRFDTEQLLWHMQTMAKCRIRTVQTMFASDYFNQLNIDPDEKDEIKRRVLSKAVDFHEVFLGLIGSYHFNLNAIYTADQFLFLHKNPDRAEEFEKIVDNEMHRLAEKSLSLDDAAEDLVETVTAGKRPKWHALFAPGYKKSDEKRKRAYEDITHKGISDTRSISPLEYMSIAILKTLYYQGMIPARMGNKDLSFLQCRQKVMSLLQRLHGWVKTQQSPEQLAVIEKFFEKFDLPKDYIIFLKSYDSF